MNRRRVGTEMERVAAEYLESEGFEILEMNYRCRIGEIDIVAREGRYLVFTEVKYRTNGRRGDPLEAVNARKQRTILRVAMFYLKANGLETDTPCRFDAVGISENGSIRLIRNAFSF
ncbi:MAG: YraN family protein [Eubacteriales bacterium]